jgi:hypothetical protein
VVIGDMIAPLLTMRGINNAFHYAPLHYLVFIARAGALCSKRTLRQRGYDVTHFRRTSREHDEARGFPNYVHLSLKAMPPILRAKLKAGFPHFEIKIPTAEIEKHEFHLSRFNIAKCRYLRRGAKQGPLESLRNGRYYGDMQLPIGATDEERGAILDANYPKTMVEILIPDQLALPPTASFVLFSEAEYELAATLLEPFESSCQFTLLKDPGYVAKPGHLHAVTKFLNCAAQNPEWKGDGLDFDGV